MIIQLQTDLTALILFTTFIGFAVLIMGRQMLWVFIAGLGFTLGLLLSSQYYDAQFEWQVFAISSLIAILGALLAYTVERLAAAIAGFATIWYLTILLIEMFNLNLGQIEPIIPYILGVIGGLLMMLFFDWGVIITSSLAGAAIVVSGMSLSRNVEFALLIMFSVIGIAIQGIWFLQER
jgi:hypothetical protein